MTACKKKSTFEYYLEKAEAGDPVAQDSISMFYYLGEHGVKKDYEKAFEWASKSAEHDDVYGQLRLGVAYNWGDGVERDFAEAVYWYQKAAEQGCAPGQYMIGQCYEKGIGVPVNIQEAKKWYQKAADQKFEDAMAALLRLEESEESEPDKQAQ